MAKKPDAQTFLAALQGSAEPDEVAPVSAPPPMAQAATPAMATQPPPIPRPTKSKAAKPTRAELKHFGGYVGDETLEKIALLRVRLKLDNSQLVTLAIDDLHRKHTAKRAFGDA